MQTRQVLVIFTEVVVAARYPRLLVFELRRPDEIPHAADEMAGEDDSEHVQNDAPHDGEILRVDELVEGPHCLAQLPQTQYSKDPEHPEVPQRLPDAEETRSLENTALFGVRADYADPIHGNDGEVGQHPRPRVMANDFHAVHDQGALLRVITDEEGQDKVGRPKEYGEPCEHRQDALRRIDVKHRHGEDHELVKKDYHEE
mmetsp:Transcript_31593/g.87145  ORF Transcript_31593/g.87145 Transcript_31593/m.87145 type:complete len:201 (+) Transcript_31593:1061-1663(+)